MTFTVPDFNISANLWRPPNAPPSAVTRSFSAQLYITPRPCLDILPGSNGTYQPAIFLRCPTGTDIKPGDVIEAAAGDGWYYRVRWVERMHRGFGNEYLSALLEQGSNVISPAVPVFPPPVPNPPSAGGVPPGASCGLAGVETVPWSYGASVASGAHAWFVFPVVNGTHYTVLLPGTIDPNTTIAINRGASCLGLTLLQTLNNITTSYAANALATENWYIDVQGGLPGYAYNVNVTSP